MTLLPAPYLSAFRYAPFFPSDGWDQKPHETAVSVAGFEIKCPVQGIHVWETSMQELDFRESVYLEVTTDDRGLILDIRASAFLTLSERSSDEVRPNWQEIEIVRSSLEEQTFDRIDFASPAKTFPLIENPVPPQYEEFKKRVSKVDVSPSTPRGVWNLKGCYFVGLELMLRGASFSEGKLDSFLEHELSIVKDSYGYRRPERVIMELQRCCRLLMSPDQRRKSANDARAHAKWWSERKGPQHT